MNRSVMNFLDRVGSTFVQSLAGTIVSLGTVTSLGAVDWKAGLVAAGTAAVLAAAKALSVSAASTVSDGGAVTADEVAKAIGDRLQR